MNKKARRCCCLYNIPTLYLELHKKSAGDVAYYLLKGIGKRPHVNNKTTARALYGIVLFSLTKKEEYASERKHLLSIIPTCKKFCRFFE